MSKTLSVTACSREFLRYLDFCDHMARGYGTHWLHIMKYQIRKIDIYDLREYNKRKEAAENARHYFQDLDIVYADPENPPWAQPRSALQERNMANMARIREQLAARDEDEVKQTSGDA